MLSLSICFCNSHERAHIYKNVAFNQSFYIFIWFRHFFMFFLILVWFISVGCWAAWHPSFQKGRMHITVFARVWIPMITWKLKLLYLLLPTFLHNLSKNYFFFHFFILQRTEIPLTLTFTKLTVFCCAVLYSKTIVCNNDVRKSEYKFSRFFFPKMESSDMRLRTGMAALIMNYFTEIILAKLSAACQFSRAFIFSFGHACAQRFWKDLGFGRHSRL